MAIVRLAALSALVCAMRAAALAVPVAAPAAAPVASPAAAPGPQGPSLCTPPEPSLYIAQELLNAVRVDPPVPAEIASQHAVIIVPGEPLEAGGRIAAEAYASMPREVRDGMLTTSFTKFVVVGHAEEHTGPNVITIGDDVCGAAGASDQDAVRSLRSTVHDKLGPHSPVIAECASDPQSCPETIGPTLEQQLPFLQALSNSSLESKLLPVMVEAQDVELGVHLGDALAMLVQPGGVWEAERVLFVFGGHLSVGLSSFKARSCDDRTIKILAEYDVARIATHFQQLWTGNRDDGDCGPNALPRSYASMLAAARVAEALRLTTHRFKVSRAPMPDFFEKLEGDSSDSVFGFGHVIFWRDDRPIGLKIPRAL